MAMVVKMIPPRPSLSVTLALRSGDFVKITKGISEFCTKVVPAKARLRPAHISSTGSLFELSANQWPSRCNCSASAVPSKVKDGAYLDFLRNKKIIPDADPPSEKDVHLLNQFFSQSNKLMVLTGAGISTESGIPDYRSPNGAYSSGFKPITHQQFVRSSHARKRYWARSYAGWRRFTAAQPSAGHTALSTIEKAGRVHFMVTQNVDRLHHRAGSSPLELHGTVYVVTCLECGSSVDRELFQDQVKDINPKWAAAIENLKYDSPGSGKGFGMQQRPDGDIDIDEKFWEADFNIPNCPKCNGLLKPDSFLVITSPKTEPLKQWKLQKLLILFLCWVHH